MAERHAERSKPPLQGPNQRAGRVLDQVREAIVGDGIAPMLEQAQRIGVGRFRRRTGRPRSCGRRRFAPAREHARERRSRRQADLMIEHDIALLARRLQHRQTHFQRGHRPPAVVQRRPPGNDGGVELVDHFGARHPRLAAAAPGASRRRRRSSRRPASDADRRARSRPAPGRNAGAMAARSAARPRRAST